MGAVLTAEDLAPRSLSGSWELASVPAGTVVSPGGLTEAVAEWTTIPGPMTVAAAFRAIGRADLLEGRDLDQDDWWYRCRFTAPSGLTTGSLRFEGLATVADAWLNGVHLVHSENMFVATETAVGIESGENELLLRFHALNPLLADRRPRPRWKTRLVSKQQLRRYRTTLLGRIREWCPPIAPVGPWREIRFVPPAPARVVGTTLDSTVEGETGVVRARLLLHVPDGGVLDDALLDIGGARGALRLTHLADGQVEACGEVRIPNVGRWWPHTHGAQPLYAARLTLRADGDAMEFPLGRIGFRTIEVDRGGDGHGFAIRVNGIPVFCRGACWTPLDLPRLAAEPAEYRAALLQARLAGMNLIRVGGTMVYEADAFHDCCDELGILVWQDFMFASMDYPSDDPRFTASVEEEARQVLARLRGRPSLAVLCGGSEVEQQAAMLGLAAERPTESSVVETLARCCRELAPQVPWLASSPTGGTHPFQSNAGVSHYYGVGAYRRPLDDARRAGVRFASECLAFSNVPEPRKGGARRRPGQSAWKAGVPRDPGAEWDFEEIRDHYVRLLFGTDPAAMRTADPDRYYALGAVTTGEVMERVIGEWRRPESTCRGALIWLLRDLVPGAGWGVVDSAGLPKPAWWYLRRAFAPLALVASDEGLNGLYYHAINDSPRVVNARLQVTVYREGRTPVAQADAPVTLPAHGAATLHADALFPGFMDLTYAYRFGPPGHDVIAARLESPDGGLLASAFHWPLGLPAGRGNDAGLTATARPADGGWLLTLASRRVAFAVSIDAEGFDPADNWLHLEPGVPRTVRLSSMDPSRPLQGTVAAHNSTVPVPILVTG